MSKEKVKVVSLNIEIDGKEFTAPIDKVNTIQASKEDTLIISIGCILSECTNRKIADTLGKQLGCSVLVLDARYNTNIGLVKGLNVDEQLKGFIDINAPL